MDLYIHFHLRIYDTKNMLILYDTTKYIQVAETSRVSKIPTLKKKKNPYLSGCLGGSVAYASTSDSDHDPGALSSSST